MRRGEIRWYRFAAPDKRRPVLLLTRDSALEYLGEVTVVPCDVDDSGDPDRGRPHAPRWDAARVRHQPRSHADRRHVEDRWIADDARADENGRGPHGASVRSRIRAVAARPRHEQRCAHGTVGGAVTTTTFPSSFPIQPPMIAGALAAWEDKRHGESGLVLQAETGNLGG